MPKARELRGPANPAEAVQKWVNKVVADVKRCGGKVGEVTIAVDVEGLCHITVEHNLGGRLDLHDTKHIDVQGQKYYNGEYIWDADLYIKPCTCIEVAIVKA